MSNEHDGCTCSHGDKVHEGRAGEHPLPTVGDTERTGNCCGGHGHRHRRDDARAVATPPSR